MRKLERGQPLTEVKGSLDDFLGRLRGAFYTAFPDSEQEVLWVREVFADHLIAASNVLALTEQYYFVTYTVTETDAGLEFSFAGRNAWEIVELAYVPAEPARLPEKPGAGARPSGEMAEQSADTVTRPAGKKVRIEERVQVIKATFTESGDGKRRRITLKEALVADTVNRNRRLYPKDVVRAAVEELRQHLHESAGQGRALLLTADGDLLVGEADHPSDKPSGRPQLLETVVGWDGASLDDDSGAVEFTGLIAETSKGRDILALAEIGVLPSGSLRGYGYSQQVKRDDEQIEQVTELHFTGYDLLLTPGFLNRSVVESYQPQIKEHTDMDLKKLLELLQQNPDLANQIKSALGIEDLAKMTEAQSAQIEKTLREKLGIGESDDLFKTLGEAMQAKRTLDEQSRKAAIAEAVKKACEKLPYGSLNAEFISELSESVDDVAEVPAQFARLQKRYDKIVAQARLAGMGFSDVQVNGPVIEREAGTPEFARAAFELAEGLRARDFAPMWQANKPVNRNQLIAKRVLARYDEAFKDKLLAESQRFEEANTTSDLALPYSVSRAIVDAIWPQLVATSIFDVDVMLTSPTLLYFETFAEETGLTVTVTDEAVTGPNPLNAWVNVANQRVKQGTVVLTNAAGSTTYVENTDYFVDYGNGRVYVPSGAAITAGQSLLIDYQYEAIRKGENQPIERAKSQLSSVTITAKADRLATDITNEAVEFSRSQLGYDVVQRTLGNLVREMARKIDQDLFYRAIATVRTVGNNSGGNWVGSAATPDYADAILKLGKARVKVMNRNYEPSFMLMSAANADLIANWSGFTESGRRPDAEPQANGFFRTIKGIPAFMSPQFPDNIMITGNRELVAYRVFKPVALDGPFQKTDTTGKLIAGKGWYAEQYNATESPVANKGAFVTVS